jgi:hypothetical protein
MNDRIRCAIYTRKSSEEGLEQSFNSLHAQREACEAYVNSQKHEGWQALNATYDDGASPAAVPTALGSSGSWPISLPAKSILWLSIRSTG